VSERGKLWCWRTACGKGSSSPSRPGATGACLGVKGNVSDLAISSRATVDNASTSHAWFQASRKVEIAGSQLA
jgi:hypothetical protein